MKTASMRELRNNWASILQWIEAGEEVIITQRGKAIARLVPENTQTEQEVDWASSPQALRDRSGENILSAEESLNLIHEASGKW
jgi:prevent-host-death family protein